VADPVICDGELLIASKILKELDAGEWLLCTPRKVTG